MRILLAEDDALLGDALSRSLELSGYAVDWVRSGQEANLALSDQVYAAAILDLGLPTIDGFEVLRLLRAKHGKLPVIILTARDNLEDRVKGLDWGADDYLTKPFEQRELEARLRALIRRSNDVTTPNIQFGRLMFDAVNRSVQIDGAPLSLTARELGVLELLLYRAGRVVSKEQLIDHLCGWGDDLGDQAIEVYVHRLRRKLESCNVPIRTVRGLGYMFDKTND
jgi:two-component system, OmpR family, response regulator